MCVRMAYGRGNGVLFLGRRHTEGGGGGLSDFAMGVAMAWFFLWLFLRRDGRWSYYYYYYLAGLVGVVVVMCFANESGKCHKLRGVLLFSGVWVDNQAQQLGVCIASPSYFLSSLWRMAAVDSPVIQFSYLVQTGRQAAGIQEWDRESGMSMSMSMRRRRRMIRDMIMSLVRAHHACLCLRVSAQWRV